MDITTKITIPRSLGLQGVNPIRSSVVDIYPVHGVDRFEASLVSIDIPTTLGQADEANYLHALRDEWEFIKKTTGKELLPLPESDNIDVNHDFFIQNRLGKLGLRNLIFDGSRLTGQYCVVPHPAYRLFCESNDVKLREFGANLGAAIILVTSDNKLIVQHRNPANRVYGDVPGASVAGLVDANSSFGSQLNMLDVFQNQLLEEGQEEIGLSNNVAESFVLTAIQIDKIALHHEATFSLRVDLTSDEIANNAIKNRSEETGATFRENIVALEATPEAIERLLTEVKSPFPMTHAGPILMLGDELAKASGDINGQWLNRVKSAMDLNYQQIDALCESGKYSPTKSSSAQGLPSFKSELERLFHDQHRYVACAWNPA